MKYRLKIDFESDKEFKRDEALNLIKDENFIGIKEKITEIKLVKKRK